MNYDIEELWVLLWFQQEFPLQWLADCSFPIPKFIKRSIKVKNKLFLTFIHIRSRMCFGIFYVVFWLSFNSTWFSNMCPLNRVMYRVAWKMFSSVLFSSSTYNAEKLHINCRLRKSTFPKKLEDFLRKHGFRSFF